MAIEENQSNRHIGRDRENCNTSKQRQPQGKSTFLFGKNRTWKPVISHNMQSLDTSLARMEYIIVVNGVMSAAIPKGSLYVLGNGRTLQFPYSSQNLNFKETRPAFFS